MTLIEFRMQAFRFLRRALPQRNLLTHAAQGGLFDASSARLTFINSSGMTIAKQASVAATFGARCKGLLDRGALPWDEGLLLSPGGSIHTFGMRFPIDVLFLDRHMRVLRCAPHVLPWRLALAPSGTRYVLELADGRIAAVYLKVGMRLLWSDALPNS
jgi:uncharacterized membrane protein (UPF0127 family)